MSKLGMENGRFRLDSVEIVDGILGVGTNDPKNLLHVHNPNGNNSAIILTNLATGIGEGLNGLRLSIDDNGNSSIVNGENKDLFIGTNNLTYFYVKSNGNVGIGISEPQSLLDVNGGIRAGYDSDVSSVLGKVKIGYNGVSDLATISHIDSSIYALAQTNDGDTYINAASGKSISLKINNIDALVVNDTDCILSKNVGIGTNDPTSPLHVIGTTLLNGAVGIGITPNPSYSLLIRGDNTKDSILLTTPNSEALSIMGHVTTANGSMAKIETGGTAGTRGLQIGRDDGGMPVIITGNLTNSVLTASRVVTSDANKKLVSSTVTNTELEYLAGKNSVIDGTGTINAISKFTGAGRVGNSIITDNGNGIGINVDPDISSWKKLKISGESGTDSIILTNLNVEQLLIEGHTGVNGSAARIQTTGNASIRGLQIGRDDGGMPVTITGNLTNSVLTASRVVVADANKNLVSSLVTNAELGYLSGVTSSVQTQLNSALVTKFSVGTDYIAVRTPSRTVAQTNYEFWDSVAGWADLSCGTVLAKGQTANKAVYLDANKKLVSATTTSTELEYLSGKNSVIDGAGTVNTIAKFTGAGRAGNSIITDNGTEVGIGVSVSPTSGKVLNVHAPLVSAFTAMGNLYDVNDYDIASFGRRTAGHLVSAIKLLTMDSIGTTHGARIGYINTDVSNGGLLRFDVGIGAGTNVLNLYNNGSANFKGALTVDGTTTLKNKLTINEEGIILNRSTGVPYIIWQDGAASNRWTMLRFSSGEELRMHSNNNDGRFVVSKDYNASSIFTVDTTNSRVGINDPNPTEALHVVGNILIKGDTKSFNMRDGVNTNRAQIYPYTTADALYISHAGTGRLMHLALNGSSKVIVENDGKTKFYAPIVSYVTGDGHETCAFTARASQNNTSCIILGQDNVVNWRIKNVATSGDIAFSDGTTDYLTLTKSGYLTVPGVVKANGGIDAVSASRIRGELELSGSGYGINWNSYYSGGFKYRATDYAIRIADSNGDFIFMTAPSGTADTTAPLQTRMVIKNNGFVGIGTTIPSSTFDLNGTATINAVSDSEKTLIRSILKSAAGVTQNNVVWSASGDGTGYFLQTRDAANAYKDNALWVDITNSRVGLHNNAPAYPLDVAGNTQLRNDLRIGGKIVCYDPNGLKISNDTADGADTKYIGIQAGGDYAGGTSRGGYIDMYGNEHATYPGMVRLMASSAVYVHPKMYMGVKPTNDASWNFSLGKVFTFLESGVDESYIMHNTYWSSTPTTGWKYRETDGVGATVLSLANGFAVAVAPSGTKDANTPLLEALRIPTDGTITIGGGSVSLYNATSNILSFRGNAGLGAPTFVNRSAGTKMVVSPAVGAAYSDFAMGMETYHIWNSVPEAWGGMGFKWYGGTTEIAKLDGTGSLTLNGDVQVGSTATNGIIIFGKDTIPPRIANLGTEFRMWSRSATTPLTFLVNDSEKIRITTTAVQISSGTTELTNATSNVIDFKLVGLSAPTLSPRGAGAKILLRTTASATIGDYAIGVETDNVWFSLPTNIASYGWKFYAGLIEVARLDATGSLTLNGNIVTLNNGTSNLLMFKADAGTAAPSFTTRSVGTKIVLYPAVSATATDIAMGVQSNAFWFSTAYNTAGTGFKWYGATTELMDLRGDGKLGIGCTAAYTLDVNGTARVKQDLIVGDSSVASNRTLSIVANDGYNAVIQAYGAGQGTGVMYVGQSLSHGGGICYNGDGIPAYATGEGADYVSFFTDYVSFFRRDNGANAVVFDYFYNSDNVRFRGNIGIGASADTSARLKLYADDGNDTLVLQNSNAENLIISGHTGGNGTVARIQTTGNAITRALQIGRDDKAMPVNFTGIVTVTNQLTIQKDGTTLYIKDSNGNGRFLISPSLDAHGISLDHSGTGNLLRMAVNGSVKFEVANNGDLTIGLATIKQTVDGAYFGSENGVYRTRMHLKDNDNTIRFQYSNNSGTSYWDGFVMDSSGRFTVSYSAPPSSSADTGLVGTYAWDDNYIYIKTSTAWKRVALSTF